MHAHDATVTTLLMVNMHQLASAIVRNASCSIGMTLTDCCRSFALFLRSSSLFVYNQNSSSTVSGPV